MGLDLLAFLRILCAVFSIQFIKCLPLSDWARFSYKAANLSVFSLIQAFPQVASRASTVHLLEGLLLALPCPECQAYPFVVAQLANDPLRQGLGRTSSVGRSS